ncbi:MAG: aryl-sulfate sulfotransferase [Flavobacteriales bacterium]|nr:aryl-sulfate sulfotransferase [Flavobacteriales bacterium]
MRTLALALGALLTLCPGPAAFSQFDGYVLYNLSNASIARLRDHTTAQVHTWNCPTNYSYAMALKPNGNIVRTAINNGNQINSAAVSGRVQELNPQGQVVWDFIYSTADHVTHHDICVMPNGNVLLLAYVKRTLAQLQALGYTGNAARYPGRIIEIQPTGSTAQVVWQWEMQDRFIQYVDPNKPNYMPIAQNPHRMNINVPATGSGIDWFHENGIDYNPELDQIVFSSRHVNEIFVIDHSTTTAEAAGHTGGNAGRGGDFLFRWGKPQNYGVNAPQRIPNAVHDAKWVKPGRPMEGWLMFVNNNIGGNTTAIDAINPERDGYNYPWTPGTVWGPGNYGWRHTCLAYAGGQSAAEIMPNGNVFVALSGQYMYEVTSGGQVVWQHADGPQKAFRYTCDDPGISALLGADPCGLGTAVEEEASTGISVYPNPTAGVVHIAGIALGELLSITLLDATGRAVLRTAPMTGLDLGDRPDGIYHLMLDLRDGTRLHRTLVLQR